MRAVGSIILSGVIFSLGCSVYDESKVQTNCASGMLGYIPCRPKATADAGGGMDEVVYALRGLRLDQTQKSSDGVNDLWKTIGFNLDGFNTQATSPQTGCLPPGGADLPPVDGLNGIDNAVGGKLWPQLSLSFPELEDNLCCYMQQGRGTLLLRIANWNGSTNDDVVTASLLTAADGTTDSAVMWDGTTEHGLVKTSSPTTPAALPSWQPDATNWYVGPSSFAPGQSFDAPNQVDVAAFIVDGYLVMKLKDAPLALYMGQNANVQIGLGDGHLVAKIASDFTRIESGVFGGRLGANGLFRATAGLAGSCSAPALIKLAIDAYGDVLEDGTNAPSAPCDAVSVGISFNGVRAKSAVVASESLCLAFPACTGEGRDCSAQSIRETSDSNCGGIASGSTNVCDQGDWNP